MSDTNIILIFSIVLISILILLFSHVKWSQIKSLFSWQKGYLHQVVNNNTYHNLLTQKVPYYTKLTSEEKDKFRFRSKDWDIFFRSIIPT